MDLSTPDKVNGGRDLMMFDMLMWSGELVVETTVSAAEVATEKVALLVDASILTHRKR
ncbi:hypothetical protein Bca101_087277 [Brassica carinata]